MFNSKKILLCMSLAMLGLSACGKDNYNGQYTGSEVKVPQPQSTNSPQGGYNYGYGMQQQYRSVTANLSHNGDIVTGQYDIVNNYGTNTPTTGTNTSMTESYRVEATARSSNRLDEVRLIPLNSYMGGGCILTGSLDAIDHGVRLQGTLNPVTTTYQSTQVFCMPTQVTLDRVGNK